MAYMQGAVGIGQGGGNSVSFEGFHGFKLNNIKQLQR